MSDFHPSRWLSNAHVQTIYPHLFRKVEPIDWSRERIETDDGDFFDVDMNITSGSPIVILIHGLEGSSSSSYIQGAAQQYLSKGWGVAALNLRSCSGEMNRQVHFYHSGWTKDLDLLRLLLRQRYGAVPVFGMGFSLGGNLILKYAADNSSSFHAVVAVSAPIDLSSSTYEMRKWPSRIYEYRFLRLLQQKAEQKSRRLQSAGVDMDKVRSAKTIRDVDRYLTAATFGFAHEEDYYQQSSALPVLSKIKIPTLLIQSKDDPMLSISCYPQPNDLPNNIFCLYTEKGGHVGFVHGELRKPRYFAEEEALRFFDEQSK